MTMITEVFFLLPKWFLKKRAEHCSAAQTLKYHTTAECARICEGALYLESPTVSLLMSKVFLFLQWFKASGVKREHRAAGVVLLLSDIRLLTACGCVGLNWAEVCINKCFDSLDQKHPLTVTRVSIFGVLLAQCLYAGIFQWKTCV